MVERDPHHGYILRGGVGRKYQTPWSVPTARTKNSKEGREEYHPGV
ncbi:MAG: hypothetical protein GX885_05255 [Methanomicrobiales archaeon]|nr:hypothetical protein [Methanomicrobiales archaeon]